VSRSIVALVLLALSLPHDQYAGTLADSEPRKNRVIILTDIGADPDDTMSLVRLLTYSNFIDIAALVATTSEFQENQLHPEIIREVVDAYAKAWPSLTKHETGYPAPAAIAAKITSGLPMYGMQGVGKGKNSPGSELIMSELRKADKGPLWICIWGGSTVLAQVPWKIKETVPEAVAAGYLSKLRVYAMSDQDDSGPWIRKEFSSLFYIQRKGRRIILSGCYRFSRSRWRFAELLLVSV
jgi:hypothetical protein